MKEFDISTFKNGDWRTLNGPLSEFAEKRGCACVYKDGYGQYGAISEYSERAYRDLASLVRPGRLVLVFGEGDYYECPEWKRLATAPGYGMVLETPIALPELDYVKLFHSDADEMVELSEKAGLSSAPRAIEMGDFYGVKNNGDIVSMAGEGMRFDGYVEVSDVRTHPDFRGRGYGGGLTQLVSHLIQEKGGTPFLKVRAENSGAIRLYEKLGFKTYLTSHYDALMRTEVT